MVLCRLIPPLRRFRISFRLLSFSAAVPSENSVSSFRQSHGRRSRLDEADSSRNSPRTRSEAPLKLAGRTPRESGIRVKEMAKVDRPDLAESLGCLISSLLVEGKSSEAIGIFRSAALEGRLPPISICASLMAYCSGDLNSTVFVYKEIVKSGAAITVETLNPLISSLFQAEELDLAMDQFRRMKNKRCSPNIKTFEIVISNLCAHARVEESSAVLDEMIASISKPDPDFFRKILPLFCNLNRSMESKKLLQMMRNFGIPLEYSIYSDLISCFCKNQELDDATNLLDEMSERGITPEKEIYRNMIYLFSKLGKFSEAEVFIESNHVLESELYDIMLLSYCRENRFCDASNYLMKMIDKGVEDLSSWNILASALSLDARNPRKASEITSKMIVLGYHPDDATFSSLISGYSKVGDVKNAMVWYHLAIFGPWEMDSDSFSDLIEALFRENMIQQGMRILQCNPNGLRASTVELVISHMCGNGLLKDAIMLKSISLSYGFTLSSSLVNAILLGLLEANKPEHSRVLLSQMIVEDCVLDVRTYCLLIRAMVSISGKRDDVIILLEHMIHRELVPDSETMILILNYVENLSQMNKIVGLLETLVCRGYEPSSTAYNIIIRGLMNEAHDHDACKFLDQMLERGWIPDADTHCLLVRGIVREKEVGIPQRGERDDGLIGLLVEGLRNSQVGY